MSDPAVEPKRRRFLKRVATATTAIPLSTGLTGATLATVAGTAVAQTPTPTAAPAAAPVLGYLSFSQDEAAFVEAMVNIMCPADAYTPNGVDSGLATYIDRQLAGDFGHGVKRYSRGPWMEGHPQQGFQLPLTPEQWFKVGIEAANDACRAKYGNAFDLIKPDDAAQFLKDLDGGKVTGARVNLAQWFNDLVYPLFAQACFADPIYGGNYNKVFWKMIGYPGLPATHTVDIVQYRGKPFPGAKDPKSIADFS